jgi:hypothetical protein
VLRDAEEDAGGIVHVDLRLHLDARPEPRDRLRERTLAEEAPLTDERAAALGPCMRGERGIEARVGMHDADDPQGGVRGGGHRVPRGERRMPLRRIDERDGDAGDPGRRVPDGHDDDRARGPVQQALAGAPRQDPADAPALRRADDEQRRAFGLRQCVQGARCGDVGDRADVSADSSATSRNSASTAATRSACDCSALAISSATSVAGTTPATSMRAPVNRARRKPAQRVAVSTDGGSVSCA